MNRLIEMPKRIAAPVLLSLCLAWAAANLSPTVLGAVLAGLNTSDLQIRVTGLESGKGVVRYAIFDDAKDFPRRKGRIARGEVEATAQGVTIVVRDLKPGDYAVAVFHDVNRNDEFDQGLFGIPLESYGFSNNATGYFSAPNFDEARIRVSGRQTSISITVGR